MAPAIRAKVERYQAESAIALHDYWTKGAAFSEHYVEGVVERLLSKLIPDLLAAQMADGEMSIGKGYTAGQVIDLSKIEGAAGLKGLDKFVSNRLVATHIAKGARMKQGQLGKRTARLFDPMTSREWLAAGGREAIEQRVRERRGQGVLPFVAPKKK